MPVLTDIFIYPIKSMGKIALQQSNAEIRGFQYDRRMMLTDREGNFMSQRKYPGMARFSLSLTSDGFRVSHKGEELVIPHLLPLKKPGPVTIWDDRLQAPEAEGPFSEWFSDHLKMTCRLIVMDGQTQRPVNRKYSVHDENVSFADSLPYLILGSASLDDLNRRLDIPVSMDRFRPNLVITTEEPFYEDSLDLFRIGGAVFKKMKPCSRCIITTINQTTGERGDEPLKTLSEYRKDGNKVLFGQNVVCLKEGIVKTGNELDFSVNRADL